MMSETDKETDAPSRLGIISPRTAPVEFKQEPNAAALRPPGRRAHSPPPTKPFPSSVYGSQRNSAASVSSYWSRSSRSSINSSIPDSRYSAYSESSFQSDRTRSSNDFEFGVIPNALTRWRSPGEILRRYDDMLARAQRPPEASPHPLGTGGISKRIAEFLGSAKDGAPLLILCVAAVAANANFPVCRRLDNDMINGTQLLYALGQGKGDPNAGNLTLNLERQKHIIHCHESSQLQGIWIPFERALGYASKAQAIEWLYPLFVLDLIPEIESLETMTKQQVTRSEKPGDEMTKLNIAINEVEDSLHTCDESSSSVAKDNLKIDDGIFREMAELNLQDYELGDDEAQLPIPSVTHVLTSVDGVGTEDLTVPRPLSTSTSTTAQSTSDASTSSEEGVIPTTIELKEILLTRLMDYFFSVFSSTPLRQAQNHQRGSSSNTPDTRPSSTADLGHLRRDTSRASTNKRRKISEDGDGRDGEDDDSSNLEPKENKPDKESVPRKRRLACPYFKNNPRKFQEERSCCGPGWWTVHRIKEHLYRNHAMPLHCLRCHEVFSSTLELEEHSRRPDPSQCKLNPHLPSFLQGRFNSDQEKLLRSRRKLPKEMSEAEKWAAVYRILFPAEDPASIPSPHYEHQDTMLPPNEEGYPAGQDSSELERYERFLRQELPIQVRRELEIRINETLFPLEESLRGQLVDIVRDVQLNIFEAYKASRGGDGTESRAGDGPAGAEQGSGPNDDGVDANVTGGIDIGVRDGGPEGRSDTSMAPGGLDPELAAFRPAEPYVEEFFGDFDGLLFDFPDPRIDLVVFDFAADFDEGGDSGYGGSSSGCLQGIGSGLADDRSGCCNKQ